ncbi:hypothetical protein Tco_0983306 [Tanacetum coccineum]
MTTLAEHIIVAGAENRPQMREESIFSQLINEMHTIGMTMQQVQVKTKFLNALPLEWSKFVTDVKLAKSLYTTNYDQLPSASTRHKGKEIAKPVTPQSESVSEEDSDPDKIRRGIRTMPKRI